MQQPVMAAEVALLLHRLSLAGTLRLVKHPTAKPYMLQVLQDIVK